MQLKAIISFSVLFAASVAGCLGSNDTDGTPDFPYYSAIDGRYHFLELDGQLHFDWSPGGIGKMVNEGDAQIDVELPFGFLLITGENGTSGNFWMPGTSHVLAAGATQWFLAPPSASDVHLVANGANLHLDPLSVNDYEPTTTQIVSGENVWDLEAYQRDNFPHREPGHPDGNYGKAILYFANYFEELGLEVEVDPYGTQDATDTVGCFPVGLNSFCPESFANVVATLPGTDPLAPTIFVAGGHFDMVPETTEAAFDDTSGTVATMELARVMSQYEWKHTLKFGLWGGEENGILGSQFWVQSNPDAKAMVTSYWNLDVVGMSWPAPLLDPSPHVIAAGLDAPDDMEGGGTGPYADSLLGFALDLQTNWFGFPDEVNGEKMFYYEGVVSGQANGYEPVNAQSDHTPFMAAGIPSWFIFNGDALKNPIGIHNEKDTLDNMTKYSYFSAETAISLMEQEAETGIQYVWDETELAAAKQILSQSWESILYFPLYSTILQETGYWAAPGPAGQVGAATT